MFSHTVARTYTAAVFLHWGDSDALTGERENA